MLQIDRHRYLTDYWKNQMLERYDDWLKAKNEYEKWRNKLMADEIAERLSKEECAPIK